MRKVNLAVIITGLIILSCTEDPELKTLDVNRFTIIIPTTWKLEEVKGYDSFVREITINEQEKINIDLGWYSSNLNVDNATHDITFKPIDNRNAKIVRPKNFQPGITGVYFDSLDIQKTKLQISGVDLSEGNQRLFLNAIETLKFR